jgi:glycosyltransferase involved in cell wall biosynthesis
VQILLLAQFFPPDIGGEERHVYNLAHVLQNRGHTVSVATHSVAGCPSEEALPSGVRIYRFATMAMNYLPGVYSSSRLHHPPVPDPTAVRALRQIVSKVQPDVVHAHNWVINSILPLHKRSASGKPFGLILTLHDYSNSCATKRRMRDSAPCDGPGVIRCLRCSTDHYGSAVGPVTAIGTRAMRAWKMHAIDHFISVSNAVASNNNIIGAAGSSVIPNFIPDSIVLAGAERSHDRLQSQRDIDLPEGDFLLFVGDLSTHKGVPTILRAYELLGRHRPPLVLIGRRAPDTPERLPGGATLRLEWPHGKVLEAFRRCSVAILPSIWPDPCPTTVLEAMASGCPVVTTPMGGIVDMITDQESGLLVPPGDAAELARAVDRLLGDRELRARIAAGGQARVQRFTASRVVERLEAVYTEVAPQRDAQTSGPSGVAG